MTPDGWLVGGIAGAALLVDLIFHLIGGTWLLSRGRDDLAREFSGLLREQRQEINQELINLRHELGETLTAVRQGIVDLSKEIGRVELDSHKTFVRRESFYEVMNRQNDLMSDRLKEVEKKVEDLDKFVRAMDRSGS